MRGKWILRIITTLLNGISVVFTLMFIVLPQAPLELSMIYIGMPFLAFLILMLFRGKIHISSIDDEKIHLEKMIYLPGLGLAMHSMLHYDILSYDNFWLPAICVFVLFSGVFVVLSPKNQYFKKSETLFIPLLVGGISFCYGAVVIGNVIYDKSVSQYYRAAIIKKEIGTGKNAQESFTLSKWGPQKEEDEVFVDAGFYHAKNVGDSVSIRLKAGALDIPYYEIVHGAYPNPYIGLIRDVIKHYGSK